MSLLLRKEVSWLFKELLTKDNIVVKEEVANWEEAVNESVGILEKKGVVPDDYKKKIIESIKELGPYIFIAPEIALPHTQYFEKTEVGISLLKLSKEVVFDEERKARLFFAFSAKDGDSHISMIQELATFLSNEENVNEILNMDLPGDIYDFIQTNN